MKTSGISRIQEDDNESIIDSSSLGTGPLSNRNKSSQNKSKYQSGGSTNLDVIKESDEDPLTTT
jgi:hypothetical protein